MAAGAWRPYRRGAAATLEVDGLLPADVTLLDTGPHRVKASVRFAGASGIGARLCRDEGGSCELLRFWEEP